MKICVVITHPTQFDVPVFRLGPQIFTVIYIDRSRMQGAFDPELNKVVTFQNNNLEGYNFKLIPEKNGMQWLAREIRKGRYDLVITNGYNKLGYILSIIMGRFYARKNGLRLDTVEYNNQGFLKKIFKRCLYLVLRLFVSQFFVVSTLAKKFLLNNGVSDKRIAFYGYVSDNKFFKLNSTVSDAEKVSFKHAYELPLDKIFILCVSKHNEREAPFDTLLAFSALKNDGLHLVMVGDGHLHEKLKNYANELNITNISFVGYIDFNLLPKFYAISDIFIHDSKNEPWGVSVQEAIACGVTVIASDKVGASHDLIQEGVNGFMFCAGDVKALTDKIRLALALDPDEKKLFNNKLLDIWNHGKTFMNIIDTVDYNPYDYDDEWPIEYYDV